MLKILGRSNSGNVQKVLWCATELGLQFDHDAEYGGPYGRVDEPEYLALNPNGLVPTLLHDDFVLWESNAIVRYLSALYGVDTLWPSDARERAVADKWMEWHGTGLSESTLPAFFELVRKSPEQRVQSLIDKSISAAAPYFEIFDNALAGRSYVAADHLTMGDIVFGPTVHRWMNLPIEREAMPNVERWYQNMLTRPAFEKYVAVELS